MLSNITEVIVAIAVAAIPIIGTLIGKAITSNKQAATLVEVLEPLAKSAVVAMQKLGVIEYLEGSAKLSGAIKVVQQSLTKLGFTEADETLIKNAVEKEYVALINELNQTYPQMTAEQAKAQEAAERQASEVARADELAKAQQALADAQAKVNALQN